MSYFKSLRDRHPVKLGSVIDGKRVITTCYRYDGKSSVPVYMLEGESKYRVYTH